MPKYVVRHADGTLTDPIGGKDVVQLAKTGQIDRDTLIQQVGSSSWHKAGDVPVIAAELPSHSDSPRQSQTYNPYTPDIFANTGSALLAMYLRHNDGNLPESVQEAINPALDQMLALDNPIETLAPIVRRKLRTRPTDWLCRDLCPGLEVCLFFRNEYLLRHALPYDATRLGLSVDACFERAMQNLLDLAERDGWSFVPNEWGFGQLTCPEPELTSGLLICPSFMEKLRKRIGDRILATLPTRHIVFVGLHTPDTEIVLRDDARRFWACRQFKPVDWRPLAWSAKSTTWSPMRNL